MVTICLPIVTRMYRKFMRRLKQWALGLQPDEHLPLRRIELALNEGGPALNIRIAANLDAHEDAARRNDGGGGDGGAPAGGENEPGAQDPAAVAEQTVRVTGTSLGRFIGGALMIPKISNWMGTVLFSLSRHSLLLRKFLGVRPPLRFGADSAQILFGNGGWQRQGLVHQLGANLRAMLNIICGGTKVWVDADPVWCVLSFIPF